MGFNFPILKMPTKGLLLSLALWLLIWAGYNTYPRLDFSSPVNFFQGIRAFCPILAGFLVLILLLKENSFSLRILKTPLGFLFLYTFFGIVASICLSLKPFLALYWGFSYLSVLLVLYWSLIYFKSQTSFFLDLNYLFALFITIALFCFFLRQPGALQFFIEGNFWQGRPFEGLFGLQAAQETLGMVGTRPTGFGRYAGVVALFSLAKLLEKKKKIQFGWLFLFTLSYFLLIFSQGKTEIFGFILASFFIFLLKSQSKFDVFSWSFLTLSQLVLVGILLFYLPYFYGPQLQRMVDSGPKIAVSNKLPSTSQPPLSTFEPTPSLPEPTSPSPNVPLKEKISPAFTLGGRIKGIWPQDFRFFLKSPLIGWGFNADWIFPQAGHAHNAILQALIQTGILGTIFFSLAFLESAYLLFKFLKKSNNLKEKETLIKILALFIFFAVRSITQSTGAFFGADFIFLAPALAYLSFKNAKEYSNN